MSDLLNMDALNALPQPFLMVRFAGDKSLWPVVDIDVQSGMMRIDVCGRPDLKHFADVMVIHDANGGEHDPDDFYMDAADVVQLHKTDGGL